jgi:hypothetical protein
MRSEDEVRELWKLMSKAALFAEKTGDKESYEVLSNVSTALGWVLGNPLASQAVSELVPGAEWAANQLDSMN